jgi:hypothetical protein
MKVAIKTYTERQDIENCNAGIGLASGSSDGEWQFGWRVAVRMATKAVLQTFESNRATQCQQCRQSDCIINVIISVHLRDRRHIIYNFASIRYISLSFKTF